MKAYKKNIIYSIFCASFLSILFIYFLSEVIAQGLDKEKIPTKENTLVKLPPHIKEPLLEPVSKAQSLKKDNISILTSNGVRHDFTVELARTRQEHNVGMMFRTHLGKNTGMLFLFNENRERNFWMKNTLVSLDMIFIRKDGVIHHIHPMAKEKSLNFVNSRGEVSAVLEISGGEAEILGINIGDRILYDAFFPANFR